jgi:NAD(P)-dependent dehydrogenase (short-subunit alcohol dehydrogenase family)
MLALVTGGLHRVGAAIAARLAEAGYDLALHAHRPGEPDAALAAAIANHRVESAIFAADLAVPGDVDSLVGQVKAHFGRAPDALVNSASIISEGQWADLSRDELARHLDVNFLAPMLLTRAFAAALASGQVGAVVNILDQRVLNPPIDQAAYTASKLALASVTRVMARAFSPGIRINAVAPGNTLPNGDYGADQWQRLAEAMPLSRNSAPADIAEAVAYLLGARAVTGQILFVDGGANLESYRRDFVHMMRD